MRLPAEKHLIFVSVFSGRERRRGVKVIGEREKNITTRSEEESPKKKKVSPRGRGERKQGMEREEGEENTNAQSKSDRNFKVQHAAAKNKEYCVCGMRKSMRRIVGRV
jgi:hypothetical protein